MKKSGILLAIFLFSLNSYSQTFDTLSAAVQHDVNKLSEDGCTVNINGIIAREITNTHYEILIPFSECEDKPSVKAYSVTKDSSGKWGNKTDLGDTSVEKVTNYGGMASVTEHIEYTSPKVETVNTTF